MINQTKFLKQNICTRVFVVMLLVIMMLISTSFAHVYADSSCQYSFTVNQSVKVNGGYSNPFIPLTYTLHSDTVGAPLPHGYIGTDYNFDLTGNDSKILTLDFSLPGEYRYTIFQHEPQSKDGFTHDKSVYRVYVSVKRLPSGLISSTVIRRDGDNYKISDINFSNEFNPSDIEVGRENIKTEDVTLVDMWLIITVVTLTVTMLILLLQRKKREE